MAKKINLIDENGVNVYPITSSSLVLNEDGTNIKEYVDSKLPGQTTTVSEIDINSENKIVLSLFDDTQVVSSSAIPDNGEINKIDTIKINNKLAEIIDKSVNIEVPTKISELQNDISFITYIDNEEIESTDVILADDSNRLGGVLASEWDERITSISELTSLHKVIRDTSSLNVTVELLPNTTYIYGTLSSLNITLAAIPNNTYEYEYRGKFVSGDTATTFTYPEDITWIGGLSGLEANKTYEFSIVDKIGVIVGV